MEGTTPKQTIPIEDTNAAAISYVWIMSIFIYIAKRKIPFIRFHAAQASVLFVLSVLFWFIPFINTGLELILGLYMVIGFYKATTGSYFHLPFIAPLVFSDNPIKNAVLKIGKSFQFLFLLLRTKLSNNKELQEKLQTLKKELLESPHSASVTLQDTQRNSDIAAFSYLWILSIIIYTYNEESEFVAFHARQGIILFVLSVVFAPLPTIGFYLNVLVLLICVLGFVMALSGNMYQIPLISYIAFKNKTFEDFYINIKTGVSYFFHVLSRSLSREQKESFASLRARVQESYENKKDIYTPELQEGRDIAAASYVFIGPLIWLFHRRKPFIRFHARQATLLLIYFIILYLIEPVRWLSLLPLSMMLVGFMESLQSRYYAMPFVYDVINSKVSMKDIVHGLKNIIVMVQKLFKRLFTSDKKTVTPPQGPSQTTEPHTQGPDSSTTQK